jgi:hypothetical protein
VHEPKTKTVFGVILMPDNKDQQNPCSTNLQAGVYETNHAYVDAKHVSTLKRVVQPTVPLDSKTHDKEMKSVNTDPANKHLVGETKYENACQRDVIKTHRGEEEKNADMKYVDTDPGKPQKPQVIDRKEDTDDAEMLANDAHQQTVYETSDQEEGDDKPHPEIPAAPYTAPEKGEPNTQKRLCHKDMQEVPNVTDVQDVADVPDVPRTTAHNICNTEGHQTNSWQTSPRQKIAMPATTSERGSPWGHN